MKIKEIREKMGISQFQLAEILNIPRATLASWEVEVSNPRAEMIPKIAEALNCTTDALFYGAPASNGEEMTDDDPEEVHQAVHGTWHEPEQGE